MAQLTLQNYSPARGLAMRQAFLDRPELATSERPVKMDGIAARDCMLATLYSAELLAAAAGVVPSLKLPTGQSGVVTLGAGRRVIRDPAKWSRPGGETPLGVKLDASERQQVETVYLGAFAAARGSNAYVARAAASTPLLEPGRIVLPRGLPPEAIPSGLEQILPPGSLDFLHSPPFSWDGAFPIAPLPVGMAIELPPATEVIWPLVAIVCVGLAATIGGAWYSHSQTVQVESQRMFATSKLGVLNDLAAAEIAAGKPVSPSIVEAIGKLSTVEKTQSWLMPVGLVAAGLTVAGLSIAGVHAATKAAG